jgi:hypothetical protein
MLISRDILTDDDRKYVWQDQRHEILKLSVISCRYQWSNEDADIKRYIDWWWQEICMTVSKTWNIKIFCDITMVLDQHAELDFYSASSLKQQSVGRHVTPLRHIILIPSHINSLYIFYRREENKKYQDALDCTTSRSRRPEVALTIKVGDFR